MVQDGALLAFDPAELAAIARDFPAHLAMGNAA